MKQLFVQTTQNSRDLKRIMKKGILGKDNKAVGNNPPLFERPPLNFCSYVCEGYPGVYGDRKGVVFETNEPSAYVCPIDSIGLMRSGKWLPGYERFLFDDVKTMLEKYPNGEEFRKDFVKYFNTLDPTKIYLELDQQTAINHWEGDYCQRFDADWSQTYNEVTFRKPMKIQNCRIFRSREELEKMIEKRRV